MKAGRIILIIFGYLFVFFDLANLLSSLKNKPPELEGAELFGYYVGYNFWIILAIICFSWAYRIKKKIKRKALQVEIESIGNDQNVSL